jgi:hypothetical protein
MTRGTPPNRSDGWSDARRRAHRIPGNAGLSPPVFPFQPGEYPVQPLRWVVVGDHDEGMKIDAVNAPKRSVRFDDAVATIPVDDAGSGYDAGLADMTASYLSAMSASVTSWRSTSTCPSRP